ncbi:FAD-dependent oxidoreductase [bacterium]|nr:FAD-dependent oxidoreductase [bacterium]
MFDVDAFVVGAGVVGLACAARLARAGSSVVVSEAGPRIGGGNSSRNSEVMHAGIYYATGSLKHRLCVDGRRRLYAYLAERGVPYAKCGKLIVATDAREIGAINDILLRGQANGVENLSMLSAREAGSLEPELSCVGALLSKESGIVDSHNLMLALQGDLVDLGGMIAFRTPVLGAEALAGGGFEVRTNDARIRTRVLVNAAGLWAQKLAMSIAGLDAEHTPPLKLVKGSYFSCAGRPAFSRLIYPAPVDGGLGVHVTLDLAGRMRFGPDVEWLDHDDPAAVDYAVDPERANAFYTAVRRYWPRLPDGAIAPDYAGCRPKLSGPGAPVADFRIDGSAVHGLPGLVNLFGIESPGLTSCLAIAEEVLTCVSDA